MAIPYIPIWILANPRNRIQSPAIGMYSHVLPKNGRAQEDADEWEQQWPLGCNAHRVASRCWSYPSVRLVLSLGGLFKRTFKEVHLDENQDEPATLHSFLIILLWIELWLTERCSKFKDACWRSAAKKAWCCEHSTRGCEPTTSKPLFDCDAGAIGSCESQSPQVFQLTC